MYVIADKPRFSVGDRRVAWAWSGKTVTVTCSVKAHPPASVQWLHNNMILANNRSFQLLADTAAAAAADSSPHSLQVNSALHPSAVA